MQGVIQGFNSRVDFNLALKAGSFTNVGEAHDRTRPNEKRS